MDTVTEQAIGPQTNATFPTLTAMQGVRRWLIAAPDKVPHYANGTTRAPLRWCCRASCRRSAAR